MSVMSILNPFQLLEINVISAQDLAPLARSMRTYAVAWVHPDRKLSTRVDTHGHTNPTWNDKFVFRVDEEFLRADTSAVMIEIYGLHWFRDVHVGTVRVLVGNLIPPPSRPHHHQSHIGMRFVALQVRRPSGRPQGILNIGVALLDSSMRSMPLYTQLTASAVGYRDLMGEEDPHHHHHHHHNNYNNFNNQQPYAKPQLRRVRSEHSSRVSDLEFNRKPGSTIDDSDVAVPQKGNKAKKGKASSLVSRSEVAAKGQSGKAGSLISGSEVVKMKGRKAGSIVNGSEVGDPPKGKVKIKKASSVVSDSVVADPSKEKKSGKAGPMINGSDLGVAPKEKVTANKPVSKTIGLDTVTQLKEPAPAPATPYSKGTGKPYAKVEFAAHPKTTYAQGSVVSESEVGPSASEVAAAVAEGLYPPGDENRSSVVDKWSLDGSVEGLRSKLERWRTELPPLYDGGEFESFPSSSSRERGGGGGRGGGSSGHVRRHTDGGNGLFTCFSNVFGYECSCICGRNAVPPKKGGSGRHLSPSVVSGSYI